MKVKIVLILILVCFIVEARRTMRGGRGADKTGNYLGNTVVSIINFFRGKPTPMPKNYKR